MFNRYHFAFIYLFFILFTSCVGTYETVENEITDYTDPSINTFNYPGIINARAIAHDKIEIDFSPTENIEDYNYYLHLNNESEGSKIDLDTINLLYDGSYRYILQDLEINTIYTIKISATQLSTGYKSQNENIKTVTTFDNKVADFLGIATVSAVTGSPSTSVKIKWNEATFTGSIIAGSFDPAYYQVYYIELENGYENLFDTSKAAMIQLPSSGSITSANHSENTSLTIESLSPGKTYFFGVRAVHKIYAEKDEATILDKEINGTYLYHTMAESQNESSFEASTFQVENALSSSAFNTIQTYWSPGQGNFSHYRIYLRKYSDASENFETEDTLTKSILTTLEDESNTINCASITESSGTEVQSFNVASTGTLADSNLFDCFDIPATETSLNLTNLIPYKDYQVKIALCKTELCPLSPTSTNPGILSDLRRISSIPTLAPFSGVESINNPTDINNINDIFIPLNTFVITNGHADTVEMYCVDPEDKTSYVLFPQNGSAIDSSVDISGCRGLSVALENGNPLNSVIDLESVSLVDKVKISNVTVDGTQEYCFAAAPAITKRTDAPTDKYDYTPNLANTNGELRNSFDTLIIKCSTPKAEPPTQEEFKGLSLDSCNISNNAITLQWDAPTSGLYNGYKVFYKTEDGESFKFLSGINDSSNIIYSSSSAAADATSVELQNLKAGKTYQFGILSTLTIDTSVTYSESNSNILECKIPYPIATFEEWTRVLAVGPKIDGRTPLAQTGTSSWPSYQTSTDTYDSRIAEALTSQGALYERSEDISTIPNPPGEPISSQYFNGRNSSTPQTPSFASKNGVVSLSWRDVSLNYSSEYFSGQLTCSDTATYEDCDHLKSDRSERIYGYRVYRSHDYGVTWINLTQNEEGNEALVHSIDYQYKTSPNRDTISQKMGFFTDYSVQYISSENEIDRARIYLYKVVPVYDGVEIAYKDSDSTMPKNYIQVTLPPANMALIHRKMANRSNCMSINRYDEIDYDNNYRCSWNGIGVDALTLPLKVGSTVIDQGSDLLVDRFELGCQFTRGHATPNYESGNSWYTKDDKNQTWNDLSSFKGESTDSSQLDNDDNDTGSPFRGCVTKKPDGSFRNSGSNIPLDLTASGLYGTEVEYSETIFGDCIGNDSLSAPTNFSEGSSVFTIERIYTFPGANTDPDLYDDENGTTPATRWRITSQDKEKPQFTIGEDPSATTEFYFDIPTTPSRSYIGLLDRDMRLNILAQSEFGAVYYNQTQNSAYQNVTYYGPEEKDINRPVGGWNRVESCFLNLPSIDSSISNPVWRPRWFSARDMGNIRESSTDTEYNDEIITQTIQEVLNNDLFYDSANYSAPSTSFFNTDRFATSMPLGRILSSNSAKLPPLRGVDNEDANNFCSTYKVQTGFADEDGNFTPNQKAAQKYLPSRKEHLLSATFPRSLSIADIEAIETPPTGNTKASCKTSSHTLVNHPYIIETGKTLSSDYPSTTTSQESFMTGTGTLDPLTLGISEPNYNLWHTQDCQSEFGVQDLIGNEAELNSNNLFCDYTNDAQALYFGVESSGNGDLTNSILMTRNDTGEAGNFTYYKTDTEICKAVVIDQTPDLDTTYWQDIGETYTYNGTDFDLWCLIPGSATIKPWKFSGVDSGYCSFVDSSRERVSSSDSFLSNSNFLEVFNPDGSINTDLIYRENKSNQVGVRTMANGDGRYLNFGPTNLAPSMSFNRTLSFQLYPSDSDDATKDNRYFSPLVGIPLSCLTYTGDSPEASCNSNSIDNTEFSLDAYKTNFPGDDPGSGLLDKDFYIGSSSSENVGIEETTGSDTPVSVTYGGGSTDPLNGQYEIIDRLIESPDGSETIYIGKRSNEFVTETTEDLYRYYFNVDRGSTLTLVSGGAADDEDGAGRYSLDVITKQSGIRYGFRCMAKINEQ